MGTKFSLRSRLYLIPAVNSAYSVSTQGREASVQYLHAADLVRLCVAQSASIQACTKSLLFLGTWLAVLAGHPQTEEHVDHAILGCGTVLSPGRGHLHVLEGTDKSEHGTGFL